MPAMEDPKVRDRSRILGEALSHLQSAIRLCDELGEQLAACHLQHGLELLDKNPSANRSAQDPSARLH
jgi:hypothetical protein